MPPVRQFFLPRRGFHPRDEQLRWRLVAAIFLRIDVGFRVDDWDWDVEERMILKAHRAIQVCLEHGGEDFVASWARAWAGLEPYRFAHTLRWGNWCIGCREMLQLSPAVELPLPHESSDQGPYIYEEELRWAQWKSVDVELLEATLLTADVEVVRSTLESWLITVLAAALLAATLPRRVYRRLRTRR